MVDVPCHPVCKGQPEAIELEQVKSLFAFLPLAGAEVQRCDISGRFTHAAAFEINSSSQELCPVRSGALSRRYLTLGRYQSN